MFVERHKWHQSHPHHRARKAVECEKVRKQDHRLDGDPDAPQLPPEFWVNATVGKYYRPRKTQISFRTNNEVLDQLKSKDEGHLNCINEIHRERMSTEVGNLIKFDNPGFRRTSMKGRDGDQKWSWEDSCTTPHCASFGLIAGQEPEPSSYVP